MDAVICHMALMDIPDLGATLSSIRRVLVDHGRFVFPRSGFQLCEISEPLDSAADPGERRRESVVPTLLIARAVALPP